MDLRPDHREGLDLLRRMLSASIPVIVIGDRHCTPDDRVVALELGADDYLIEPIAPRELVARVRAILRRRRRPPAAAVPLRSGRGGYRFAGLVLDLRTRHLIRPDGTHVPLTNGEYALLVALLHEPGRPLTRDQLLTATRLHQDIFDRSIDVLIHRLRRKLEGHPGAQRIIETKRGVGYAIEIAVERVGTDR